MGEVIAPQTIGITGGHGFIGQHLISLLTQKHIPFVLFEGDLLDEKQVEVFFSSHTIQTLIHLAGTFYPPFSSLIEKNVYTLQNVISIGSTFGLKRIIYTSSGAVYGNSDNAHEDDLLAPNTLYGLSKKYAEELLTFAQTNLGISHTILRISNVYGMGATKGVIHDLHNDIKNKRKVTITGDGNQKRQFVHVSDVCRSIMASLDLKGSTIFNISNSQIFSINDIILLLKKKYEFSVEYIPQINKLTSLILDTTKAENILHFEAKENLALFINSLHDM